MPVTQQQDIFLRAHTVALRKQSEQRTRPNAPKWPRRVLIFDTETRIDTRQELTFGVYRICDLVDGKYACAEEGLFYADGPTASERQVLEAYAAEHLPEVEAKSFPPKLKLKVYSRADFVEKVLWKAVKQQTLIVGFNLPFDLSRLAVAWRTADNGGFSFILSMRRSRKTGQMEPNPCRPRLRITSKDSHSAFIEIARPEHPEEWPRQGRFLDLHTLAFALLDERCGLNDLCKKLNLPGKIEHEPTGKVTFEEITYCRGDVRATSAVLNALKQEFDEHSIELQPEQAFSPASLAKASLDAMGVIPPQEKFKAPERILGIAMQAYYGGRAECRIRRVPVPIVHTDFTSQYPTVNALLGNWEVLTAKNLAFEGATGEVQQLLARVMLAETFNPAFWKKLSFFARVQPDGDILPVRASYNNETINIGINELHCERPIWLAGPDLVAAVLLTDKVPKVEQAIRMVPHGKQAGLKPTTLRGNVEIDPRRDDFFRLVIEQRKQTKNESVAAFLKVLANAGSYGLFVEITPEQVAKPQVIKVFSGEEHFDQLSGVVERQGRWYFPPVAALITAGGRLLLAMLERCVQDAGGTYLFCDTDSLCIVASGRGGLIPCPGGEDKLADGTEAVRALSRKQVNEIAKRFRALNPYAPTAVPDLLKIEKINFDAAGKWRRLNGYAISAKRYALFERNGNQLDVIGPKAHGLGYMYPPIDSKSGESWIAQAWNWLLRSELGLPTRQPKWLDVPAMMRIGLSTPHVLERLKHSARPFNFVLCPLIDTVAGYPAGADPTRFALVMPFTKDRSRWMNAACVNVYDGKEYRLALTQTRKLDRVIPQTLGYVLRQYILHPESKSLAPDGAPCQAETRGLLKRASVVAGAHRYIGKETDRRWTEGPDLSLLDSRHLEFQPSGKAVADPTLQEKITQFGIRKLMRETGLSQHTIEAIRDGKAVRRTTLRRMQAFLKEEASRLFFEHRNE